MQSMLDSINEWLRELLIEGTILNLSGIFNQSNQKAGEIAVDIGTTPPIIIPSKAICLSS